MNWYEKIIEWFNGHFISAAILLAFVIAILRTKGQPFWSRVTEGLLCSCLTIGIYYGVISLYDANQYISLAIGSFVGYIGTDKIKELLLNRITAKLNSNEEK